MLVIKKYTYNNAFETSIMMTMENLILNQHLQNKLQLTLKT
jgi:hypothetical protein